MVYPSLENAGSLVRDKHSLMGGSLENSRENNMDSLACYLIWRKRELEDFRMKYHDSGAALW